MLAQVNVVNAREDFGTKSLSQHDATDTAAAMIRSTGKKLSESEWKALDAKIGSALADGKASMADVVNAVNDSGIDVKNVDMSKVSNLVNQERARYGGVLDARVKAEFDAYMAAAEGDYNMSHESGVKALIDDHNNVIATSDPAKYKQWQAEQQYKAAQIRLQQARIMDAWKDAGVSTTLAVLNTVAVAGATITTAGAGLLAAGTLFYTYANAVRSWASVGSAYRNGPEVAGGYFRMINPEYGGWADAGAMLLSGGGAARGMGMMTNTSASTMGLIGGSTNAGVNLIFNRDANFVNTGTAFAVGYVSGYAGARLTSSAMDNMSVLNKVGRGFGIGFISDAAAQGLESQIDPAFSNFQFTRAAMNGAGVAVGVGFDSGISYMRNSNARFSMPQGVQAFTSWSLSKYPTIYGATLKDESFYR
jgi:hypothetical protein